MARHGQRTPIARARGLGAAGSGFSHWWVERVTGVALVPLTVWFVLSVMAYGGREHAQVTAWIAAPPTLAPMVLLLISAFWHAALGLQVIVEDYVHSGAKVWVLLAVRFACFALAVAGLVALFRIAVTSWTGA
jgi:succinate dehydrogenase / fumarate reductase, membrane anchor subunit